mgnify:CR=1 FL=1
MQLSSSLLLLLMFNAPIQGIDWRIFFDFHAMQPKPECLKNDALSEDDEKAIKMAFNLFSGDTPSINNYGDSINQVKECKSYTVKDLFCSSYAPYFWQAIQIRYPEYTK